MILPSTSVATLRNLVVLLAGGILFIYDGRAFGLQASSDLAATYTGIYVCSRGPTSFQLVLERTGDSRISGVLTFYERGGSPTDPLGSFRLAGTYDAVTRQLDLRPGDWIKPHALYTPVGLTGTFEPQTGTISGKVVGRGCSLFHLKQGGSGTAGTPLRNSGRLPPQSSQITKIFESEQGPALPGGFRPLDTKALLRADLLKPIYDGRFELATPGGLDNIRYLAQLIGGLAEQCPNLKLEGAKFAVLPYLLAGVRDFAQRLMSGKASGSEQFQAAWLLMLQLNQVWSCQYDANRPSTRDAAQASCNAASDATSKYGVLPSVDAAFDLTVILATQGCQARETSRLARQLIDFARQAHTQVQFTGAMPPPDSAAGKAYARMFENCARRSPDNGEDAWCGCYVRTVNQLKPSPDLLEALSNNPFVDGSTYMSWVAANVPGGSALYDCATTHRYFSRGSRAQRTTACLIDQHERPDGTRACVYRAAWGEFTRAAATCERTIGSREWGYREVDCAAGGETTTAGAGAREWKEGAWSYIDYEGTVPAGFVPDLPADVRKRLPLTVRFLARDTAGTLRSMNLDRLSYTQLRIRDVKLLTIIDRDIQAVDEEEALVLTCEYAAGKGVVDVRKYWYEKVPVHVSSGRLDKRLAPHPFDHIKGAASKCPAMLPAM